MAATVNFLENVGWAQAFHSISMSQLKAQKREILDEIAIRHAPGYFLAKLACTKMGDSEIVHPSVIQPTTLDLIDIFVVSVGSE
jgi:hypothetical protein